MWKPEVLLRLRNEGNDFDMFPIGRSASIKVVQLVAGQLVEEAERDAAVLEEIDPMLKVLARAEASKLRAVLEELASDSSQLHVVTTGL